MPAPLSRLLAAVLGVALLTACSSEGTSRSDDSSPIVGTWKVLSDQERIGTKDWTPSSEACRSDNTEEYKAGGAWTLYAGDNQCGGGGTGISKGTWRLAAANTKVIYTYERFRGEYESTVESLTETEMILTKATGETNGRQWRTVYRKQ